MGALAEAAKSAKLGPGLDPDTQLGPLVSAEQRDRVMSYIDSGKQEGAELLAGGETTLADSGGYYVDADAVQHHLRRSEDRSRGDLRAGARRLALRLAR